MSTQKRKRRGKKDRLVLNLLIIVALVLLIFEGKLVLTMVTHRSAMSSQITADSSPEVTAAEQLSADGSNADEADADSADRSARTASVATVVDESSPLEATLAGLPGNAGSAAVTTQTTAAATLPTVSNPDSPAIVPEQEEKIDDSYFSDAAFIGDSRMEGFRLASGITQGNFFTSVGMSLSSMRSESVIQTADGNITVAAALSGGHYNKIYIMLGTNDLGEYDWNSFQTGFTSVLDRFREIQPDATFYICSVIYVEESLVSDSSYINNTNVDTINSILLDICESEDNCYYLDLNEILSNGYGSLIEGASSDGVHLYEKYCKEMLSYLKSHYVEGTDTSDQPESETETEPETQNS
jgi:hypothetical protein